MKKTLFGLTAALALGMAASAPGTAAATYVYGSYGYGSPAYNVHYDRGHHYGYWKKRHKPYGFSVRVKRHPYHYSYYPYHRGPYAYYRW